MDGSISLMAFESLALRMSEWLRLKLSKNCAVPMDYDKLKKFGLRYCNINRTGPHIAMSVLAFVLIGVATQGEYIRIYWEGKMAKWRKKEDKSIVALTN
uniref:Uncharacterized protein n=1 Tax=Globodera rostochiensis TaxID=31243 RepID=A0A914GPJ4_GLORO